MTPDKAPYVLKDSAPNPKIPTGALGGTSLAILITWVFEQAGVYIPLDVALAMAGLLTIIVGYLTPGRQG